MPELPEVEVVKRSLQNLINKSAIKSIRINDPNLRYKINQEEVSKIIGKKILKIKRRSKFLIFIFNKKKIMIVHLGMTGKLILVNKRNIKKKTSFYYKLDEKNENKHNHIIFYFKNSTKLIYNDVRKFGFIKFDNIENIKNNFHLKNLGPEPLEKYFDFKYFKKNIKNRKKNIKNILMDQKFVSGLGNIYANEILFFSKIKPQKKVEKLNDSEIKSLVIFTKKILKNAILKGGSSIKNFESGERKIGLFQENFKVYGKHGEKCSNSDCKGKIKKIVIAQRASFYCANCQK